MSLPLASKPLVADPLMQSPALHWIDGQWVDSAKHTDSIDPATGKVIGSYADGGKEEAAKAVDAARRAFDETETVILRRCSIRSCGSAGSKVCA